MTEFSQTNWAKADFSGDYIEKADIYIVERRRMLGILRSFYEHFIKGQNEAVQTLDLGCGDGLLTHELLRADDSIRPTLVDGSKDMLDRARRRLKGFRNASFVKAEFQELIRGDASLEGDYHFIMSSMAIHHLNRDEKKSLFGWIRNNLRAGGFFVNIDVVLAPADPLDRWYMKLWEDWMKEKMSQLGRHDENVLEIIKRYKSLEENKPDTLDSQLETMKDVGFGNVDCFFKYGIFAVFGGMKQTKD